MARRYYPYKSRRVTVEAEHMLFQREIMKSPAGERRMTEYGDEVIDKAQKKAAAFYSSRRRSKKTIRGGIQAQTKKDMWAEAEKKKTVRKLSDRNAYTFGLKAKDGRRFSRKGTPTMWRRDYEMYLSEKEHGFIKKQLRRRNTM